MSRAGPSPLRGNNHKNRDDVRTRARDFVAANNVKRADIPKIDFTYSHGDLVSLSFEARSGIEDVISQARAKGIIPKSSRSSMVTILGAIESHLTSYLTSVEFAAVRQHEHGKQFSRQVRAAADALMTLDGALDALDRVFGQGSGALSARLQLLLINDNWLSDEIYGERRRQDAAGFDRQTVKQWVRDMRERIEPIRAAASGRGADPPNALRRLVNGLGEVWFEELGRSEARARPTFSLPDNGAQAAPSLFLQFVRAVAAEFPDPPAKSLNDVVRRYCADVRREGGIAPRNRRKDALDS